MERNTEVLRSYLAATTSSGTLEEMIEAGPEMMTEAAGQEPYRDQVLHKISRGEALNVEEQFYTEAIIIPDRRPAIDVLAGTYTVRHADWQHFNEDATRRRLEAVMPSIGRIELPGHPSAPYGGTAFVVGPGLLMTNRHVAELFASGLGTKGLRFIPGRGAGVDFLRERDMHEHAPVEITEVRMIHPYWDMALLAIDGLSAAHRPLSLETGAIEDFVDRDIAVVGYPAFDPRNSAQVQDQVFGGVYGIKRLRPGKIRGRVQVKSYQRMVSAPTHDSSTLGGDSGSCVIDIATSQVLALHFGGRYLQANYCVAAGDLAQDGRVVDAGVAFAEAPPVGPVPWAAHWTEADRTGSETAQPPAEARPPEGGGGSLQTSAAAGETRITIPLEITVKLGQTGIGAVAEVEPEAPRMPFHDPDYTTRTGYDEDYLGFPVALPTPRTPSDMVQVSGSGHFLHYHHFSLAMHRTRRQAAMSVANVDASEQAKTPENLAASAYTRKGLSGLNRDKWMSDPRIDATEQLPERFFEKDRQSFDKGHVVRRDDVAWGGTYEEMRFANGDSFHVTNCAPQISGFNQSSRGVDNWGDLENLILKQAEAERLAVFGGPVFDGDDPVFVGVDETGPVRVRIPRRYWKVIVARKADALQAFGFLLEQDLSDVDMEFAVPVGWARFMEPVTEIERLCGFDFSDAVRAADQFDSTEAAALASAAGVQPRPGETDATRIAAELDELLSFWHEEQERDSGAEGYDARFVVELAGPMADETIRAELEQAFGLRLVVGPLFPAERDLDRFRIIEVPGLREPDRADLFDLARAIRALLGAISVEPDLDTRYFDADPELAPEGTAESADFTFWCWAGDDDKPDDPDWAVKKVGLPDAWARSDAEGRPARGAGIVVFQPDTGVVPTHPELPPEIHSDPRAANFVEPGTPPVDPMQGGSNPGHGTGTGSVVASPASGSLRGAAPEATLVPIRCVRSVVIFNQSRLAQAVNHARLNGAHVITMSLGGVPSFSLRAAIGKAVDANIIVLAAAGNCVGAVVWPARYDDVIAVAGTNVADRPWQGSCRGGSVDISAPAEFVLRADPRVPGDPNLVSGGQGTSFAVAMTAGAAACWLAHYDRDKLISDLEQGTTLQDRFRRMLALTARVPSGFDTRDFGAGIFDSDKMLSTDPFGAGTEETVFARQTPSLEEQVRELFAEVGGAGQAEAAAMAARDPASLLELACVGLDMARFRTGSRRSLEALPPIGLSRGLKASAGPGIVETLVRGDR